MAKAAAPSGKLPAAAPDGDLFPKINNMRLPSGGQMHADVGGGSKQPKARSKQATKT